MIIERNNIVYNHILARFEGLSMKGRNKKDFIKRLLISMKNAPRDYGRLGYGRTHNKPYIMLSGKDPHVVSEHLQKVFDISSFPFAIRVDSDVEAMKQTALQVAEESDAWAFRIEARRGHKLFPTISDETNRAAAGEILWSTELEVNVREPQLYIQIGVHQKDTYVMAGKIAGAGGYPVGADGKALVILSGGTDSPVVSHLIMKRSVAIECVHYVSPLYTSQVTRDKILEFARQLAPCQGHIRVHVVPFTDLQLAVYKDYDESCVITVVRHTMYRIVQRFYEQQHCLAIVNGESAGQVASQTLESMQTTSRVTTTPVIRPVARMDKVEIINVPCVIDTYDISMQPFKNCCTILTSKNLVTKPTIQRSERLEARFDYESLLQERIEKTEHVDVYPKTKLDEDIFQYKLKTLTHANNVR